MRYLCGMARKGGNPNIAEVGKNYRFGAINGPNPSEAGKKGNKALDKTRRLYRAADELITPEVAERLVAALIERMEQLGDVAAFNAIRDILGEKPKEQVEAVQEIAFRVEGIAADEADKISG